MAQRPGERTVLFARTLFYFHEVEPKPCIHKIPRKPTLPKGYINSPHTSKPRKLLNFIPSLPVEQNAESPGVTCEITEQKQHLTLRRRKPPACNYRLHTAYSTFRDGRRTSATCSSIGFSQGSTGRGAGIRQQPGKPVGRDEGAARGCCVARTGSQVRAMRLERSWCCLLESVLKPQAPTRLKVKHKHSLRPTGQLVATVNS